MSIASFNATIEFSRAAIRGCFVLNGAAAVAVLAYIGNFCQKAGVTNTCVVGGLATMSNALLMFSVGAFLASLCFGSSYIAQDRFTHNKGGAVMWTRISIGVFVSSMVAFLIGLVVAWKFFAVQGI